MWPLTTVCLLWDLFMWVRAYTYPPVWMSVLHFTQIGFHSPHRVLLLIFFSVLGFLLTYFVLSLLISSILISLFIMEPKEQCHLVVFCYFSINLKGMKLFLFLALCSCLYVIKEQSGAYCLAVHLRLWSDSFIIAFFSPQGCGLGRVGQGEKKDVVHCLWRTVPVPPSRNPSSATESSFAWLAVTYVTTVLSPFRWKSYGWRMCLVERGKSPGLLTEVVPGKGILHLAQVIRLL